jgi:hypothetical protein
MARTDIPLAGNTRTSEEVTTAPAGHEPTTAEKNAPPPPPGPPPPPPLPTTYHDPTISLVADGNQVINFYHIPTDSQVFFKAWLTDFSDRFETEWSSEPAYGRMDPIQTYKQTTRTIEIGWDVIAASVEEAEENMKDCQKLFKMLYPTYGKGDSSALQAPPLMKVRFVNLIKSAHAPAASTGAKDGGLTGTISGFSYSPDLDAGFFEMGAGTVYPQLIKLECSFVVLHTHDLGYDDTGSWKDGEHIDYPYGAGPATAGDSPTTGGSTANTDTSGTSTAGQIMAAAGKGITG